MSEEAKMKCQYAFCNADPELGKKMCTPHLKYHAERQREYRKRKKAQENSV